MLEVPRALLDERRAKGLDTSDEMWRGEHHMIPPPSGEHQAVASELSAKTVDGKLCLTWEGGSAEI